MTRLITRFVKSEEGATAIEYGLIASLVAVGLVTALSFLGPQLQGVFNRITTALTPAAGP